MDTGGEGSYYEVLNVRQSSTPDQIKQAYKKAALRYHPDKNPGSADAAVKFGQISEAYQVLSDPVKKSSYDRYGIDGATRVASQASPYTSRMQHTQRGGFFDPFKLFESEFGRFHDQMSMMGPSMSSSGFARSTSVSTSIINGQTMTTRKEIINGTTTVTVEKNGQLISKTINGTDQPNIPSIQ